MDVPRGKEVARRRLMKRISIGAVIVVAAAGISYATYHLKPAAPTVEMGGLWPGTVKRGPMDMQERGLGVLKPEQIYWINAAVDSRIVKIVRRAGLDSIKASDVIMVLGNPDRELDAEKAEWVMKQDEANLSNLKVKLQSDKLDQRASLAELESQYTQAKLTADRDMELTRLSLKSDLESKLSVNQANQLRNRVELQRQRLAIGDEAIKAQIESAEVALQSSKANYELKKKQVDELTIRAGVNGVLQEVDVEVGQRVAAGTLLAKVADPTRLKAVLQIPETRMKNVRVGQDASVDTRNGIIPGRVIRIDPAATNGTVGVDVALRGALPDGARAELSVDGTIQIAHLSDVVYMDRPVSGEPGATIGLFKIDGDGRGANRVNVKLGQASVNTIEVKDGLKVGDRVILSDMSQYDSQSRIRLNP